MSEARSWRRGMRQMMVELDRHGQGVHGETEAAAETPLSQNSEGATRNGAELAWERMSATSYNCTVPSTFVYHHFVVSLHSFILP
jgi:hypothetical protein